MTYVYEDVGGIGYWRNISPETQIGWSRGGTNIFGEVIPASDTWGSAVKVAAEDLGFGAIAGLYGAAGYEAYKVGKDLSKRRKVDISQYDKYIPDEEMVDTRYQEGQHKYVGPSRRSSGSGDTTMYEAGGNAGYKQLSYRKKNVGRKAKRYNVIKRFVSRMKNDCIVRWQSLNDWGLTAAGLRQHYLKLHKETIAEKDYLWLPVYCFNLSGPPMVAGPTYFCPMFQLRRRLTAPFADGYQYEWSKVEGWKNNKDGTAAHSCEWNLEHIENKTENLAKVKAEDYTHDWSDVNLLFQGCKNYPVRTHVYTVRFDQDGAGPIRQTDADEYDTNVTEEDVVGGINYFWDRFLLPKVVHPLAKTKKSETTHRNMTVLSHDTFTMEPELSISEDLQPHQYLKKYFIRNGRFYKGDGDPAGNDVQVTLNADQKPQFATSTGAERSLGIVERKRDMWLMIVGEVYNQVNSGWTVSNTATFDVNIRSKFTLYDI